MSSTEEYPASSDVSGSESGSDVDVDDEEIVPPQGEPHGPEEIITSINGLPKLKTVHDIFLHGCKTFPDQPYLGTRVDTGETDKNGNPIRKYEFKTYSQILERVKAFGSGLEKLDAGDFVGLYGINREEWVVAEKAILAYSRTTVPLYDTLGPAAVEYSLGLADVKTVVCEGRLVQSVCEAKTDETPEFEIIVSMDEVTDEMRELAEDADLEIYSFEEVIKMGKKVKKNMGKKWGNPPDEDTLFTLCFTSGTTGNPKGVMLTHGNVVAQIGAVLTIGMDYDETDIHISYLPLAHVFERMMHVGLTLRGSAIGFYGGDTRELVADIQLLKPTIFATVPRLLNKIYASITGKAANRPCCLPSLFNSAVSTKVKNLHKDKNPTDKHGFYDKVIFKKARLALGGRVRLIVTGSAPLGAEVMDFVRIAFGATVLEGYGQTECAAACTITRPGDFSTGHVGKVIPCCNVALGNVTSMGYYAEEDKYNKAMKAWEKKGKKGPQPKFGGEICVRGAIVMNGYYKNDEKTDETIDEDGWLHTGDIGIWTDDGSLKIVDRKKNIFKLAQGEYVAPEKVENVLKLSPFVGQIYVHGTSLEASTVAIIVPAIDYCRQWAKEHGVSLKNKSPEDDLKEVCKAKGFKEAVMESLNDIATVKDARGQPKLFRYEIPADVHFEVEEWQPGSEHITSTFKLQRKKLDIIYEKEIAAMYKHLSKAQHERDGGGKKKKSK